MKFVTLRVPKPFSTGPQFDEDGELEPGSWPAGLPHEGMKGWTQLSPDAAQGLMLCEFLAEDDWPLDEIPGGWRATASYAWDMQSRQEYDEDGNKVGTPYTVEAPTNEADYLKYIPAPVDENGDPTGDPAVYHRMHGYLGWPDTD